LKHLVFQLHGSIVSWGKPGGDEQRPSFRAPSKSALLGLIAACSGIKRSDQEGQAELNKGLRFAVAVESIGEEIKDYHTALPPEKERTFLVTRKEEIEWGTGNAVLTKRAYRVDSLSTACFWKTDRSSGLSLEDLKEDLLQPHFCPYLGRKSCSPSLPFYPRIVDEESLQKALQIYWEQRPESVVKRKLVGNEISVYWEGSHPKSGLEVESNRRRSDQPLSRDNWTFRNRNENISFIQK